MLAILKKIFTFKSSSNIIQEDSLSNKLSEIIYNNDINKLFYTPVNKLYIINTYSSDFNDLIFNLPNTNFHKQIIAINIHSYFNNSKADIKSNLERVLKYIQTNKINKLIEHDLFEIINTFEYLNQLENNNV